MGLICFECKCEIATGTLKFMLPLEKPYTNLWFHRDCYNKVKGEIEVYLAQNVERVYNYKELSEKMRKNNGKTAGCNEGASKETKAV